MRFDYVAVPWPPDAPEPQPAARQELELLGFRLLGGCALAEGLQGSVEKLAKMYADDHAEEFRRWAAVPGQIFSSPDADAFAHLDWLWSCRHVTLTSALQDGSLVQTTADWGAMPQAPKALQGRAEWRDPAVEQRSVVSDQDADIVPGPMSELWTAHRRRLAGVPTHRIASHTRLGDFVAIYQAESRARSRWAKRMPAAALAISFVVMLVPYLLAARVLATQPWWVGVLLVVLGTIGTLAMYQAIWPRTRRWHWLRPKVTVPVPRAAEPPPDEDA